MVVLHLLDLRMYYSRIGGSEGWPTGEILLCPVYSSECKSPCVGDRLVQVHVCMLSSPLKPLYYLSGFTLGRPHDVYKQEVDKMCHVHAVFSQVSLSERQAGAGTCMYVCSVTNLNHCITCQCLL